MFRSLIFTSFLLLWFLEAWCFIWKLPVTNCFLKKKWPKTDNIRQNKPKQKSQTNPKPHLTNKPYRSSINLSMILPQSPGLSFIHTWEKDNLYIPLVSLHANFSELFMGFLDYPVDCLVFCVPELNAAIYVGGSSQQDLVWYSEEKKNPKHLLLLILIYHLSWIKKHIRYQWGQLLCVSLKVCLGGLIDKGIAVLNVFGTESWVTVLGWIRRGKGGQKLSPASPSFCFLT